jgi:hypothetical protein
MKIFFSSPADCARAVGVSNRRAVSGPCLHIAKVGALFRDAKLTSAGQQFSRTAVARKLRHAIT